MATNTDHTRGIQKRAMIATSAIFGSRILGLVREQVFAFFFGAGAVLDAFYVAFRIPNLLRDLAAEGALSQSFITIFSQKLVTGEKQEAHILANKTITFIMLVMGVVTILGEIFAPFLVRLIGPGFLDDPEKFNLTVQLLRILFPYIFFISLAALVMGILNANKKFFIPFSASTFCNFTSICAGLLFAYFLSPDYIGQTYHKIFYGTKFVTEDFLAISSAISGMALGTLLGGLGQFLFQLPTLSKIGFFPKLNFNLNDAGLIKVLKLTGPAIIAGAAVQINVMINTIFASFLADGSVSYLQFSFRLMQFPLGLFGVAIAAASAPVLAQLISQKRNDKFRESIQSSIQMSLFLTLPSMIGLMTLGYAIISLIYQHGHFTPYQTTQTSYALMAYALGISSYSLIKIYQPAFLAFHDAKTPMKISLLSILVNATFNSIFIFVFKLDHWAIALCTSIVALFDVILQSYFFRRKLKNIWTINLALTVFKTLIAAVIMGVSVYFGAHYLKGLMTKITLVNQIALVIIPILYAIPVYLLSAYLLRIPDALFYMRKIKSTLLS
jgi:putative peptidoglycan lipid II flippase